MEFKERLGLALEELSNSDIEEAYYKPPYCKVLWKAGLNIRPPHYTSFLSHFLFWGTCYTIAAWLGILLALAKNPDLPQFFGVIVAVVGGLWAGGYMAKAYSSTAAKNNLSKWKDLGADENA